MARWIRNCKLPVQTLGNFGSSELEFFMRYAFEVLGWTVSSDDGDSAWTDSGNRVLNQAAGVGGFEVLASAPRNIYHPGGGFTSAMEGMVIALKAVNDQNASMWQITEYVDVNNVKVDPLSFSPLGWTDEDEIGGYVLDFTVNLTTGAWVELDPPSGNNRARMLLDIGNYLGCYAQPRAGLGLFTNTPGVGVIAMYDDDDLEMYLNAYAEGNNILFFKFDANDSLVALVMWGELEDASVKDTFPGFVFGRGSAFEVYQVHEQYVGMLGAATYPSIIGYPDAITFADLNAAVATYDQDALTARLLINGSPGFARLRKAWVTLANTAGEGAFVRGSLPVIRATHRLVPQYAPIDGPGEWYHLSEGICVPRNGPLDLPLRRK